MCKGSLQIYIYQLPLHLLTGRMLLKCFAETLVLSDPLKRLCKAAVVCLQGCGGHKPPVQTNKQPKKKPQNCSRVQAMAANITATLLQHSGGRVSNKKCRSGKNSKKPVCSGFSCSQFGENEISINRKLHNSFPPLSECVARSVWAFKCLLASFLQEYNKTAQHAKLQEPVWQATTLTEMCLHAWR